MELADYIRPVTGKSRTSIKKNLISQLNKVFKTIFTYDRPWNISYGLLQPNVFAMEILIRDTKTIGLIKEDVEKLGLPQTSTINGFQRFIQKAFKANKLLLKCTNPKINKDYAIDTNSIEIRADQDPRVFNPDGQTGLPIKIQFKIFGLTPKAKKHLAQAKQINGHTPYTGSIMPPKYHSYRG